MTTLLHAGDRPASRWDLALDQSHRWSQSKPCARRTPIREAASLALFVVVSTGLGRAAARAEVEIPRRNPMAKVTQQVGLTEVSVEYRRLAARGRAIWGATVPYGKVWLTGETPAARITFTREVVLAGQKVPAGAYALLLMPEEKDWTFVLNTNAALSDTSTSYRPALDVARVKVRAEPAPPRERLTFVFSELTDERGLLDLQWQGRHAALPIDVNTRERIDAEIRALEGAWLGYADVARYLFETRKDYDAALVYVDKSLALKETRYNDEILASILAAQGRHRDARARAQRALQLGRATGDPSAPDVEFAGAVAEWSPPAGASASGAQPHVAGRARAGASPSRAITSRAIIATPALVVVGERVAPSPSAPASARDASPRQFEIATSVERGRADLEGCYRGVLRQNPGSSGRLSLSVAIGASGIVKGVSVKTPPHLAAVEPCVKEAVSHWVFPPSPTEYGAEIPIVLQGADGKDKE